MKSIIKAFTDREARGWTKLYFAIDLHDTIIEGKYNLHNDGAQFFPNAVKVLRNLSARADVYLILWTSSHRGAVNEQIVRMEKEDIIFDAINENPDQQNTELCDFSQKFYFNVLLDDKAGFDGNTDWFEIEEDMRKLGVW
jgi:hypothetical protein